MSHDKLDKNGVWQGTKEEYHEFSKDIIDDACDGESHGVLDAIFNDILTHVSQEKLESIISEHCENLEEQIGSDQNRLGLLIKVNENEGSPIEPMESPIVDPIDLK